MWSVRVFDQLASPLNLWRAFTDFARDKRRRPPVAAFIVDADREVHRLARELGAGRYRPGPYRLLLIRDPKRRVVAAAPVRDRVVHHAVHRVLAPHFDRSLIAHTYACLPGRGSHHAVLRFLALARRHRYVLQLDVRRYFYSIDRDVLRRIFYRRLPEPPLRALLERIMESGADLYRRADVAAWLDWDGPMAYGVGLPIGNLTSQWWGNLYLDGLDHYACRALRVPAYQRYMDDVTVFGDDRGQLVEVRDRIGEWLAVERHLALKEPDARPERTDERLDYLGYRVTRGGIDLGDKARRRMRTRLVEVCTDSERMRSTVASYGAAWMFGPGRARREDDNGCHNDDKGTADRSDCQ